MVRGTRRFVEEREVQTGRPPAYAQNSHGVQCISLIFTYTHVQMDSVFSHGGRIQLDGFVPVPRELADRYRREGLWQGRTLGELFDEWVARAGDREAVAGADVDGIAHRMSYAALQQRVNTLAAHLHHHGIVMGSRVVVQLPNVPGFVTLLLALFKVGAIPVLALPQHGEHEVGYMLDHSGATAYAVARTFKGRDCLPMARALRATRPSLRQILVSGESADDDVIALDRLETTQLSSVDRPRPAACDVALFLLSGGTTGVPKLIPRTHDDYALNLRESARLCGFDESTVYLAALPAAHNFPLGCPGILGTLHSGGRVVLAPSLDAESALSLIEAERVTVTALVPAIAIRWMESPGLGDRDVSSLKVLQVGGQRFQPEHARLVRSRLGCTLQQVFGMAEGLLNYTRLDDPEDVMVGTQGRPMLAQDEVRVVDENDREVAKGAPGELLTRGPYTLRGYFRAPDHNARCFTSDGWYRSGDLVRWHNGNLIVEGRIKDLINRGGEKISAEELENLIAAHPAVTQAAVVAMPDRVLGERVCAFLVTRDGASVAHDQLNQFLVGRGLARFKLPERVEILAELPLTKVGKVDKNALRGLACIARVREP
jgi:2,3-dihydroxybenzoate-AMP ligase